MKIEVKLKNQPGANLLGLFTFCPFFTVFGGKMDQKWAGSKFFGFLWIWVNVLDDPLKEKKNVPPKTWRGGQFSCFAPQNPLNAPLDPQGA